MIETRFNTLTLPERARRDHPQSGPIARARGRSVSIDHEEAKTLEDQTSCT
jgi:hypothetical protein